MQVVVVVVVAVITCWLAVGAFVVESRTLWQAFDSKTSIPFCPQPRFANTFVIFIEPKTFIKVTKSLRRIEKIKTFSYNAFITEF